MRFPGPRTPPRAARSFRAPRHRPTEEFRDSSLFALEIQDGIQLGTIDLVEREIQPLDLAFFCLKFQAEDSRRRGRPGRIGLIGSNQPAREDLAPVERLAQ